MGVGVGVGVGLSVGVGVGAGAGAGVGVGAGVRYVGRTLPCLPPHGPRLFSVWTSSSLTRKPDRSSPEPNVKILVPVADGLNTTWPFLGVKFSCCMTRASLCTSNGKACTSSGEYAITFTWESGQGRKV